MGILPAIGALALTVMAQAAAPEANEVPAAPRNRSAPDYPMSCRPEPGKEIEPQRVIVTFAVTRDGQTENVRVRETTDPCFNETAIAAARSWTYEPRRVNGARRSHNDLEVTVTFIWEGDTQTEEFDARPLARVAPRYPDRCARMAKPREKVLVEFDVTEEGRTENIRVVESSKSCFERSATDAVAKWRYQPRLIAGKPTVRKNVQTQITYELVSKTPPGEKFRRAVGSRLKRVQRSLRKKTLTRKKCWRILPQLKRNMEIPFRPLSSGLFTSCAPLRA